MSGPLERGDLLTIAQALQIVPVGRTTLYALCESGELPHYRVGGTHLRRRRILIHRDDLRAYLEKSRQARPETPKPVDVDQILVDLRSRRAH